VSQATAIQRLANLWFENALIAKSVQIAAAIVAIAMPENSLTF
jgi:hypothetical protein